MFLATSAGAKDYIIVDDGGARGGGPGQYVYGHYWKTEDGKLIKVNFTQKRLNNGKIRIRESERDWQNEYGFVDQEERQKRPWYYKHWIRSKEE
jgi:hypothetical protein